MTVTASNAPVQISTKPKYEKKKEAYTKDFKRDKPTLKELQSKKYPFPDSDLSGMLDDFLEKKVIQFPESKRPDQANRTNDSNYCQYHRLVSHPLEKCITLMEKIMQLVKDGKIILDLDYAVTTNHKSVMIEGLDKPTVEALNEMDPSKQEEVDVVQFGSLEPVAFKVQRSISSPQKTIQGAMKTMEAIIDYDNEGWTLVTRKKPRKQIKT
ncbi:hypothetical protein KSS87_023701, partial [Heliosperma pusillum]